MGSSKKPHDATRQERKAKKRKLEDAVPDLPGDSDEVVSQEVSEKGKKRKRDANADGEDGLVDEEKEKNERKKEKKRQRKEAEEEGGVATEVEGEVEQKLQKKKKSKKERKSGEAPAVVEPEIVADTAGEAEEGPKKSKKERKADRRAKEAEAAKSKDAAPAEESTKVNAEGKTNGDAASAEEKKSKKNNRNREKKRKGVTTTSTEEEDAAVHGDGESKDKEKKDRFICFIGNLPFTANTDSVTKHFAAVKPISVRALTQKDNPTKSKGIAFVEFEGYDHMKTCLKMFHHSMFDDGLSAARKINVELTAGGGGNTKDRKAKIQDKNQKLNEQRARRMQEEAKVKLEKSSNAAAIDESAIHPSRRARVPGV